MIVKDFVLTKEKTSYIMNGVVIEVYPVLAPTQVDIQDTSGEILPLCHPTAYTLLKLKNCTLPINRKCHSSNFFFLTSSSMYILFCKLWLTIYCCLLFWLLVCVIKNSAGRGKTAPQYYIKKLNWSPDRERSRKLTLVQHEGPPPIGQIFTVLWALPALHEDPPL